MVDGMKLTALLFEKYNGFADKRIRDLSRSATFIVDDRSDSDTGSDGKLYSYFCAILVTVLDDDRIKVELRGNVPKSTEVTIKLEEIGAVVTGSTTAILVARGEQRKLNLLADAISRIVAAGRKYDVRSYKYVCPRVAGSLRKLSKVLDQAWLQQDTK